MVQKLLDLAARLGHRRVLDDALLQHPLPRKPSSPLAVAVVEPVGLHQDVVAVLAGQRCPDAGGLGGHVVVELVPHHLEGRQRGAQAWPGSRAAAEHRRDSLASPQKAAAMLAGCGYSRSTTRVMTPSVPSLPMNSCFRS